MNSDPMFRELHKIKKKIPWDNLRGQSLPSSNQNPSLRPTPHAHAPYFSRPI